MNNSYNQYHQAEHNFFASLGFIQRFENLVAYVTEVPVANLNPAFIKQVNHNFTADLNRCISFYAKQKFPWTLILPDHLNVHTDDQRLSQLKNVDLGVAMALALDKLILPTVNPKLIVRPMENDLLTWSIPLLHGFESVPEITNRYMECHKQAIGIGTKMYHFSGFINETVVTSLTISLGDRWARLDDIATMPAFQKQGYATALICTALNYAINHNIETCFLEASMKGLNVYKRLGFEKLFKNYYFEQS